jgi:3-oxoacyl-[acyl-carrier protein] reductase
MRVLVTGGSRGIGKAIAHRFSCSGHVVCIPSREELDLSKEFVLPETNFDIVVNNAGINPLKRVEEITDQEVMQVNYFSPLSIVQQCLPHMIRNKYGRIVNIGSIWIEFAKEKRSAYAASKNALHSLSRAITAENGRNNILANTVSPGFIGTDLTYKNNTTGDLERLTNEIPLGRLGNTDEVADLVYYLTVGNNFIAGQNIVIDGGYTCTAN